MSSTRQRSPRFPSYPLQDAVEFASKIYENVHRSAIDAETAFKLMGFKGRSGASSTALGAIRQFGLIEGQGENTKISDLALTIFEPESKTERNAALTAAFKRPDVFSAISDRFDDRIPQSDEPIRAFIIRELGFSQAGADQCLASLRTSLGFLNTLNPPVEADKEVHHLKPLIDKEIEGPVVAEIDGQMNTVSHSDFVVQLGGGTVALIQIKGRDPTAKDLRKLGKFVALQAELLSDEDESDDN